MQTRIDIFPDTATGFTVSSSSSSPTAKTVLGTYFNVRLVRIQRENQPVIPLTTSYTLHSPVISPKLPEKPGVIPWKKGYSDGVFLHSEKFMPSQMPIVFQ